VRKNDPVVSVLEEIEEQTNVAGGNWVQTVISPVMCGISYLGGNDGYVCTLTVECQNNCRG
jgi:hypothetical protein